MVALPDDGVSAVQFQPPVVLIRMLLQGPIMVRKGFFMAAEIFAQDGSPPRVGGC